ncbi:MAG: efflux RND transporter periplasmic adaptor subunit [Bacteroidales bacterium]
MKKKLIIGGVVLIVILVVFVRFKMSGEAEGQVTIETAKVKKGNVSNTITATGTVQAIKTVSVGCQVSGIVDKLYVDYNTHVKAGQLLAELDRRTLKTSLENALANLDNAKAEMTYQTANFNRIKALSDKNLVAQNDYDQAIYNYSKAQASLKTAQLEYDRASINLNYASIHSPIDGVILERAVDEGQTVAASFNTPTLFSIANDLTQMQVEASIDEADIGKVKIDQRVSFTVDAFTDLKFEGKITQIRLQPVTKSNVVTYTVIVKAPNPDLKLMPGMTASISVFVEEANDVLVIPSKAIHFNPDMALLQKYLEKIPGPKEGTTPQGPPAKMDSTAVMVWVKNGNDIHPIPVKTGIDDDLNVEIQSGLSEGEEVVYALNSNTPVVSGTQATGSPFMPRPPSRSNTTKTKN